MVVLQHLESSSAVQAGYLRVAGFFCALGIPPACFSHDPLPVGFQLRLAGWLDARAGSRRFQMRHTHTQVITVCNCRIDVYFYLRGLPCIERLDRHEY